MPVITHLVAVAIQGMFSLYLHQQIFEHLLMLFKLVLLVLKGNEFD